MSLVKGNPEHNFFLENPELKYISVFKKLLEEYSEKEASKIMWSIFLYEDPDSKFYRIPKELRLKEIQDNYYKIHKYKNKYVCNNYNHFNIYENINITKEQYKMLVESKDIIVIKMIIDIIKHENNIS